MFNIEAVKGLFKDDFDHQRFLFEWNGEVADKQFVNILRDVIHINYPDTISNPKMFDKIYNNWLYDTSTYDGKKGTGF